MADVTSTFSGLSSTESSNAPAGGTVIGAGLDDNLRMMQAHVAAWRDLTGWAGIILSSVAGTNTITATLAAAGSVTFGPTALAANQRFILTPANTNTGATTLNITSPNGGSALGAKNVFFKGSACVGGELIANVPTELMYDGTQFNILGSPGISIATEQATTSGTSKDFTIPSWAKRVTVMLAGVSTDGTSGIIVQLGDAGGIETSNYLGSHLGSSGTITAFTSGFLLISTATAARIYEAVLELTLEDSTDFTWMGQGQMADQGGNTFTQCVGRKATSAAMTTVRLTTVNGTDAFDAGSVSVSYQ